MPVRYLNNFTTTAAPSGNGNGSNKTSISNSNYTMNTIDTSIENDIDGIAAEQRTPALNLCGSKTPCIGQGTNTAFMELPNAIIQYNAKSFFRYDHTPISFKGGHCHGDNFAYATAIPFDIDNSHSDNPIDWFSQDDIMATLKQLGINFWICASRNHLISKEGKAPRPKFHVYLPLSNPLKDW